MRDAVKARQAAERQVNVVHPECGEAFEPADGKLNGQADKGGHREFPLVTHYQFGQLVPVDAGNQTTDGNGAEGGFDEKPHGTTEFGHRRLPQGPHTRSGRGSKPYAHRRRCFTTCLSEAPVSVDSPCATVKPEAQLVAPCAAYMRRTDSMLSASEARLSSRYRFTRASRSARPPG